MRITNMLLANNSQPDHAGGSAAIVQHLFNTKDAILDPSAEIDRYCEDVNMNKSTACWIDFRTRSACLGKLKISLQANFVWP
jgi:hypothetical protein